LSSLEQCCQATSNKNAKSLSWQGFEALFSCSQRSSNTFRCAFLFATGSAFIPKLALVLYHSSYLESHCLLRIYGRIEQFPEIASVVMRGLHSTTLKELDVGGLPIQLGDIWALEENCPNISSLKLGGSPSVDDVFVKQCVKRLKPKLKVLDISDSPRVTTSSVKAAVESGVTDVKASRCKRISGALVINYVPKGTEKRDNEYCLTMTQCKNLKWFHLDRNLKFNTIKLSQCTSLEYCHIYDNALEYLHLSGCVNLQSIDVVSSKLKMVNFFSCKQLSEESIYKLIENCPTLKEINLSGHDLASQLQQVLLERRLSGVHLE